MRETTAPGADATITLRSDMTVELLDHAGSDGAVAAAARVSTRTSRQQGTNPDADSRLIDYLMRNRHGSPFEHSFLTYYVEAPIFVTRQMLKHRIGVSINEESGRYKEFRPVFYCPADKNRSLVQVGPPKDYRFNPASDGQWDDMRSAVDAGLRNAWDLYRHLLALGLSREVARMHLPLSTFSSMQITFNARSLMHFLALRREHPNAAYPSHPQWETGEVATAMELHFERIFPLVHAAFNRHGRLCP